MRTYGLAAGVAMMIGVVVSAEPLKARVIGHRGFAAKAPENTLVGLRAAIEAGADAVEFDVRRTRDGQVMLMHDRTLDRTTSGSGRVDRAKAEAVGKLDAGSWKGVAFVGEPVPLLADALALCRSAKVAAVIELKDPGLEKAVSAAVDAADGVSVAVIAFDDRSLRKLHARAPKLPLLWLCDELPKASLSEQLDYLAARAEKCGASGVDLDHHLLSAELIAGLHARGLIVWCYTVNTRTRMRQLYDWGIDGITSDRPDWLRQEADSP